MDKVKEISNNLRNSDKKHEFTELILPELIPEEKKDDFLRIEEDPNLKGFEGKSLFKKIKIVLTPFYFYQNKLKVNAFKL